MNFDQILLRLKQQLGVTTDREVAEALGLSKTAFAERKRRQVFPVENLSVLAGKRTDLNVQWILSGDPRERIRFELENARIEYQKEVSVTGLQVGELAPPKYLPGHLESRDAKLVEGFNKLSEEKKQLIEATIAALLTKE